MRCQWISGKCNSETLTFLVANTRKMGMDRIVTATEANQRFSEILRDVADGDSVTVTSRGKPVARIVPANKRRSKLSLEELYARWDAMPPIVTGPWKREDLYDRTDRDLP